jgi:hypothetical protein
MAAANVTWTYSETGIYLSPSGSPLSTTLPPKVGNFFLGVDNDNIFKIQNSSNVITALLVGSVTTNYVPVSIGVGTLGDSALYQVAAGQIALNGVTSGGDRVAAMLTVYSTATGDSDTIVIDDLGLGLNYLTFSSSGVRYMTQRIQGGNFVIATTGGSTADFSVLAGAGILTVKNTTGYVGIGTSTPSAKLHVHGLGSGFATYSLIIENSSATSLFTVRDDGYTGFNQSNPAAQVHVVSITSAPGNYALQIDALSGLAPFALAVSDEGEVSVGGATVANIITGGLNSVFQTQHSGFYFQHLSGLFAYGTAALNYFIAPNGVNTVYVGTYTASDLVTRTGNTDRGVVTAAGDFGFGITSTLLGRVHIQGNTSDSTSSALYVVDSSASVIFQIRDDHKVAINPGSIYDSALTVTSVALATYSFIVDNSGDSPIFVVTQAGTVGIGNIPNAGAVLDLQSTTGALIVPRMTTLQKNAITPVNGMILYDTDLDKFQGYEAGAWTNFSAL